MNQTWQLQEAKSRFSELVDKAVTSGPQVITKRGVETAVLISINEYKQMREPEKHLVDFIMESPLRGLDLDLSRSKDPGREVDL